MDPAGYNLTSPYSSGHLDYYNLSTIADYDTNDTTIDGSSYEINILQKVAITISSIVFILGIIGNGLVIWIAGFRMKKTISVMWFLNLAIADFLCCASMPLYVAGSAVGICNMFSSSIILCFVDMFMLYFNMVTSVLLLTAMSVDRWVSVMWPFWARVHRTRKLVGITAGIIWVLSFILSAVIRLLIVTSPIISLVIMFVIPFLIILITYVTIFFKFRNSNRPQRSRRPYRIITAVILGFFICWAPYHICPLLPKCYSFDFPFLIVNAAITCLACFNSCINPIIYVFTGQDFKLNFLRFIPFRIQSALDENPDDPCEEQEDPQPAPSPDV